MNRYKIQKTNWKIWKLQIQRTSNKPNKQLKESTNESTTMEEIYKLMNSVPCYNKLMTSSKYVITLLISKPLNQQLMTLKSMPKFSMPMVMELSVCRTLKPSPFSICVEKEFSVTRAVARWVTNSHKINIHLLPTKIFRATITQTLI